MRGMDLIEVARQCPDLTVSIRLGDLIEANQSLDPDIDICKISEDELETGFR